MLDPTEALLLGSGNQLAVAQKRRRGIGVKSVEAEDRRQSKYPKLSAIEFTAHASPKSALAGTCISVGRNK